MEARHFWTLLLVVTTATIGLLYAVQAFAPRVEAVSEFTMISIAIFCAIVAIAYALGVRAARNKAKGRFVQLVMMLIILKMLICVVLVVFHVKLNAPDNKLFVIPFLMIYLIFTIFEVYVLEKLAHLKPD